MRIKPLSISETRPREKTEFRVATVCRCGTTYLFKTLVLLLVCVIYLVLSSGTERNFTKAAVPCFLVWKYNENNFLTGPLAGLQKTVIRDLYRKKLPMIMLFGINRMARCTKVEKGAKLNVPWQAANKLI
jgi:hypothetical protein